LPDLETGAPVPTFNLQQSLVLFDFATTSGRPCFVRPRYRSRRA